MAATPLPASNTPWASSPAAWTIGTMSPMSFLHLRPRCQALLLRHLRLLLKHLRLLLTHLHAAQCLWCY